MPKTKMLEYILYGLTIAYSFVIAGTSMGSTVYVSSYLGQRAGFYLAEAVLLIIGLIRCSRLYSHYDHDYFKETEKIFAAADCCFVLIVIITVISVAAMVPIFIFLPKNVFDHGAANGLLVSLLITGLIFLFYTIVIQRFKMVKKRGEEIRHPLGEKPEDFFSFIHSMDEKQEETAEEEPPFDTADTAGEMPKAADILEETFPDVEEFQQHLQQISLINRISEPAQLWECPYCGSMNPDGSRQCSFCGADCRQRKEDNND